MMLQRGRSYKNPFATPLEKLIKHQRNVRKYKATYIKAKEFGGMAGRKLKTDVRRRRVLEAWVFDLASDLVCGVVVSYC